MELVKRILIILFILILLIISADTERELVSIKKRYNLDIILFLDLIAFVAIPLSFDYLLYVLIANALLMLVDYIYGLVCWGFRYKKINDAIHYGIIENSYNDMQHECVKYIVRKNTCVRPFATGLDDGYENIKYTMLQMYNSDTKEFICNLSEEELWEMIKIRTDKSSKQRYQYYKIKYPK